MAAIPRIDAPDRGPDHIAGYTPIDTDLRHEADVTMSGSMWVERFAWPMPSAEER